MEMSRIIGNEDKFGKATIVQAQFEDGAVGVYSPNSLCSVHSLTVANLPVSRPVCFFPYHIPPRGHLKYCGERGASSFVHLKAEVLSTPCHLPWNTHSTTHRRTLSSPPPITSSSSCTRSSYPSGPNSSKTCFLSQPKLLSPNEPQTNDSTLDAEIDGLPVIHVSEPSRVLDKLFRLCYPLDDPPLEAIDEVAALLTVALKYDLRKPIQMTSRRLRELMPTASLRVYAIACKLELEDEARAAAVVIREQKYVGELEDISIGAYHRLLYFCETGNDPGGLFFTGRPMRRVNENKKKPKRAGMGSVSATPPEPPPAAFAPLVAHPFNIANPDIIIQASDGVEFGFSKSFIELASPVLLNMGRDCPIPSTIQIPESSGIVSILFYICGPLPNPSVTDLLDLHSALIAATKYGMQKAVQFLQAALVKQTDVPSTDPFLLYTIACHHDMRDLALRAAKRTLRTELTNTLRPEVEAIDIPAGYLYRLLEYHRRCYDAIRTIFVSDSWIGNDWYSCLRIHCRRLYYNGNLPCWYSRYMTEVGRESWPGPVSAVKDAALQAGFATSDTNCGPCIQNDGAVQLVKFTEYVAETMTRLENEVILEWPSHADPSPST